MCKIDIRSSNIVELENFLIGIGEPKFRAKQIFSWVNQKFVTDFSEMTNVPKKLQERLSEISYISPIKIIKKQISARQNVTKYLLQLGKATIIESVLMRHSYGNTVCVSTQGGCLMGCKFCASTMDGLDRNLTAGEIVGQIIEIQKDINERISNVVLMGSGEPFDNYKNVMKFIEIINDKHGLLIGQRSITISTCGLVDKIYDFTDEGLQVNLAISLHAPNNKLRNELMPINRKYDIKSLIEACKHYSQVTKRRITYEYMLIEGVNDSRDHAKELAIKLKSTLCNVNLIPINNVVENDFKSSNKDAIKDFVDIFDSFKIEATVRKKMGDDIDAACGQLRRRHVKHSLQTNLME